jgi:hypothetical protein
MKAIKRILAAALASFLLVSCSADGKTPLPDCDINAGPCVRAAGPLGVTLSIAPRPVTAMKELVFEVSLEISGGPVSGASVNIELSMPGMYMGRNMVELEETGGGRYGGKGVLPRCPSGGLLWKADVLVAIPDYETRRAAFLFETVR